MNYFEKFNQYFQKYFSMFKVNILSEIWGKKSGGLQTSKSNEAPVATIYAQYCNSDESEEIVRTQTRLKVPDPRSILSPPPLDRDLQDTIIAKPNIVKDLQRVKWLFNVVAGVDQGRQYLATTPEVRIGRKPENHICLKDPKVSRFHALIRLEGNYLVIKDLESANGTSVNGQRIQEEKLFSGDMFKVGDTIIQITSQLW